MGERGAWEQQDTGQAPAIFRIPKTLVGSSVLITRPNNVNPYVVGGIYGDGVDARFSITTPALPADTDVPFYQGGFAITAVQGVAPTAPALTLQLILFATQPTTVLKDQDPIALTDADIARVLPVTPITVPLAFVSTAGGPTVLNTASRRGIQAPSSVLNFLTVPANTTLWAYLWAATAYVPAANETLRLTPVWTYTNRVRA